MLARILLALTFLFSSTRAITDQVVSSSSSISIMNHESKLETYIVFLRKSEGMVSAKPEHLDNWYQSFLPAVTTSKLKKEEAKAMEKKERVRVSLAPECFEREDNPYSQLLGLTAEFGILESFKLWKRSDSWSLGHRTSSLVQEISILLVNPPIDGHGHGTHTASTTTGNPVPGASFNERYNGTAVGIASSAHLAIYQVCSEFGSNGNESSALCDPGSLKVVDVRGKVMLCERGGLSGLIGKGQEVKDGAAAAMIVMNDEFSGNVTATNLHLLPASHLTHADGLSMKAFI
ncbi:hypothetical protein OIU76_004085 [Salix suchowensis]|nr:hypothetical protein OIU76_004085 [Salix suchowensis]